MNNSRPPVFPETYSSSSAVSVKIFDRIHRSFAEVANPRRLAMTPDEQLRHTFPEPIAQDPRTQQPNMHGILPQTQAPIDFTCTVCLEKIQKGTTQQILNCGHKFCAECFNSWANARGPNTTCPICRTPVEGRAMGQPPMGGQFQTGGQFPPIGGQFQTGVPSLMRRPPFASRNFSGTSTLTPQQQALAILMRTTPTHH